MVKNFLLVMNDCTISENKDILYLNKINFALLLCS